MCGIAGIFDLKGVSDAKRETLNTAMNQMLYRGPDHQAVYHNEFITVGHNRLSIIDTGEKAHQPMISEDGNHILVFNGEIFNYQLLRTYLEKTGLKFYTHSDTEVLLRLLIQEGKGCLQKLNGFFALAYYNKSKNEVLLARDRYGEKPLKYSFRENQLCFSSETKTLIKLSENRKLNKEALSLYLQFNYIPAPFTIVQDCFKLMPGEYVHFSEGNFEKNLYYTLPEKTESRTENEFKKDLTSILHDAVKIRMISDVPLGCFLSGGIDSTIIAGLAKEYDTSIRTFSIGFPEEKHFDETPFALEASKYLGTKHEVFPVNSKNMLVNFDDFISRMDEPFADSSSLAVFELCKKTKSEITVALSGDGADELFAGYHKHLAHHKASKKNISNFIIGKSNFLLKKSQGSRNSKTGNKIRQLKKYASSLRLSPSDRYLRWASWLQEQEVSQIIGPGIPAKELLTHYIAHFTHNDSLHDVLLSDIKLVLANDMLVKVDLMSMANSLEVRPPFLDYRLVELAISIPENLKINGQSKKHILKECFTAYLPASLLNRPKKGFEVPLHSWFNGQLKSRIENDWLNKASIQKQNLFSGESIENLKSRIFSSSPGDSPATVWALIVFQEWIKHHQIEL